MTLLEDRPTTTPAAPTTPQIMSVRKRDGSLEPVDLNKIVNAVARSADGLNVDVMHVATRTISGLHDGVSTSELDQLSIATAAALTGEEPDYSRFAARLLSTYVEKEVMTQDIHSFSQSIKAGLVAGIISEDVANFVAENAYKLNQAIDTERDNLFRYFGLRTVYDRYLLKDPQSRQVIETPQYFFMRVACGLAQGEPRDAIELYDLLSSLEYLASSPTLFNSGTSHAQMSSCFAAGTPVFTVNRGLVAIEDIEIGDQTITHTGATATVTQLHTNPLGDRTFYNLRVSGHEPIAVTGNHRLWASPATKHGAAAEPRWIDVDNLAVGDYVALADGMDLKGDEFVLYPTAHDYGRNIHFGEISDAGVVDVSFSWTSEDYLNGTDKPITRTRAMSPVAAEWVFNSTEGARFLGQWFGDGSVLGGGDADGIGLVFANKERGLAERWASVGERIFGVKPKFYGDNNDRGWGSVSLHSAIIGELFTHTFGQHSNTKSIPDAFYGMGKDFFVGFLKGLIESDGSVHGDGRTITVTMANKQLVQSIAAWGRSHGLPITYQVVTKHDNSPEWPQATLSVPVWAVDLTDLGKVYDDSRIAKTADATPSTQIKIIDGRTFMRVQSKTTAEPVETVYNLGVLHDDHSYSVNGLAVANCYLLDSPEDDLMAIYDHYRDIAALSKFAGGIGVSWSRIRSTDSLIKGTNGLSNGIVPWLHTLDSSVAGVNQGGRRKGAACVYLETWHADIIDFLELKDNTGNPMRRTHHLNTANWVPDEFMRRVEADDTWTLFDPKVVPQLVDLYGDKFDEAYRNAEAAGLGVRQLPARELYHRMMRTLGETGNGWMTFKDPSNRKSNQTRDDHPENVIHLSNLCTEILEVTDTNKTTAVCNLSSVNLGAFVRTDGDRVRFDFERLGQVVRTGVTYLDRVIDINFYPTHQAATSNKRWRPVGLGQMGLQDVFFQLGLPFDSPAALDLSTRISEHIYFNALSRSVELAKELGPHPSFAETKAAQGIFQWELWDVQPRQVPMEQWEALRADMMEHGLRNSLLLAIAPTATIASIAGCYECIEPQVSNLFKRETLSGEFLQINEYLVTALKERGLWTDRIRRLIKESEGSIADIEEIPEDVRSLFRTAWELSMKPILDLAAGRGAFIDQAASTNLFMESANIDSLSAMYFYAWKLGLKTTYYLRSRPRTRINKTTTTSSIGGDVVINSSGDVFSSAEALACSLANPAACDACG